MYLEIKGKRRTGKTFTALLNIIAKAVYGVKGDVLIIGRTMNYIKDKFSTMKHICKQFKLEYISDEKDLVIEINNLKIYFVTKFDSNKKQIVVSDISEDTILIDDGISI